MLVLHSVYVQMSYWLTLQVRSNISFVCCLQIATHIHIIVIVTEIRPIIMFVVVVVLRPLLFYSCASNPSYSSLFTARCTLVQSAVLRSHVVCLSVCLSVCL